MICINGREKKILDSVSAIVIYCLHADNLQDM